VIATCRRPAEAKELQALREELSTSSSGPLPRLSVLPLDVQDEASIAVRPTLARRAGPRLACPGLRR